MSSTFKLVHVGYYLSMIRTVTLIIMIALAIITAWVADIVLVTGFNLDKLVFSYISVPQWAQAGVDQMRATYTTYIPPWIKLAFILVVGGLFLALILFVATSLRSIVDKLRSWW